MNMGLEDIKVAYALAPGGVRVTIPLIIKNGEYDVDDINARLLKGGVPENELGYVIYSVEEPTLSIPPPQQKGDVPGVQSFPEESAQPKIPIPTAPNTAPPMESEFSLIRAVPVTKDWHKLTGCSYNMYLAASQKYFDVQSMTADRFTHQEDYKIINDGRLKLCYGLVWRRVGMNFLDDGSSWEEKITYTKGMSKTTTLSVTASVGYSGGGASASLSSTFSTSLTISESKESTYDANVKGVKGSLQTACLWVLNRVFYTEVDGKIRGEGNPFSVTTKLSNDVPYQLIDTFGTSYEALPDIEPTLMVTPFKA